MDTVGDQRIRKPAQKVSYSEPTYQTHHFVQFINNSINCHKFLKILWLSFIDVKIENSLCKQIIWGTLKMSVSGYYEHLNLFQFLMGRLTWIEVMIRGFWWRHKNSHILSLLTLKVDFSKIILFFSSNISLVTICVKICSSANLGRKLCIHCLIIYHIHTHFRNIEID